MGSRRGSAAWAREEPAAEPVIDVLVATAGRRAELATVLAGLAAQDDPPFRVLVSDQSDDHGQDRDEKLHAVNHQTSLSRVCGSGPDRAECSIRPRGSPDGR